MLEDVVEDKKVSDEVLDKAADILDQALKTSQILLRIGIPLTNGPGDLIAALAAGIATTAFLTQHPQTKMEPISKELCMKVVEQMYDFVIKNTKDFDLSEIIPEDEED